MSAAPNSMPSGRRIGQVETIPLADIHWDFYVRRQVNEDRVLQFADAYEARAHVKPIKVSIVTQTGIEGRHRFEALLLLDRTEAQVEWVAEQKRPDALITAFQENMGGALPPQRADIYFVIEQLLALDMSRRDIIAKLGLPKSVAIKYLDHVQSNIRKNRINQARIAVTDGNLTVTKAAEQFGIELDDLKVALRGRRKAGSKAKQKLADLKRDISNRFKGFSNRNAVVMKKVITGLDDGVVDPMLVRGVIAHIGHSLKRATRSYEEWKKRAEERLKAQQSLVKTRPADDDEEEND